MRRERQWTILSWLRPASLDMRYSTKMAMKKKTRSGGRGTTKGGRRFTGMREIPGSRRMAIAASQTLSGMERAKATIRRLRGELTRALKRIEELRASAHTDFLLGIH